MAYAAAIKNTDDILLCLQLSNYYISLNLFKSKTNFNPSSKKDRTSQTEAFITLLQDYINL